MFRNSFLCLALLSTTACAATGSDSEPAKSDGAEAPQPPEPVNEEPPPPPPPKVEVSVASVQMIQNCPDTEAEKAAAKAAAKTVAADEPASPPASMAKPMKPSAGAPSRQGRGVGPMRQPCTQSRLQIEFASEREVPAKIVLKELRVLAPAGDAKLGTVQARLPTSWQDGAYAPWDQAIGPKSKVKASYKLNVPDWNAVEKALGDGSSYGKMFILEVDVEVDGEVQTVRSPQFPREQPHVVVT